MKNDREVPRIAKILSEKNSISVCLPININIDTLAAGTALYLALIKMGKSVGLASAGQPASQYDLVGEDKLQSNLVSDGKNLVVSFPYVEGSVDKVTYNIENETFNLVIQPREGADRLNPKQVKYNYTGGKPDAVVVIFAPTLNSLGDLYTSQKDAFSGIDVINVDRHFTNAGYGSINYIEKKSSSVSEMVLEIIRSLKVELDKDIATNLYSGIVSATNNFTAPTTTADTFESTAFLLKRGAVKKPIPAQGQMKQPYAQGQGQGQGQGQAQPQGHMQQGHQHAQQKGFQQTQQQGRMQQDRQHNKNQPQIQQQNQPQVTQQPSQQTQQQNQPFQQPQFIPDNYQNDQQDQYIAQQDEQIQADEPTFSQPENIQGQAEGFQSQQDFQAQQIIQEAGYQEEPDIQQIHQSTGQDEQAGQDINQAGDSQQKQDKKTPKEWLKPKIFKSSNLI